MEPASKKPKAVESSPVISSTKKSAVTTIVVKCNCGFPNNLFIRGEGIPGLNWERGIALKNVKSDEWTWETDKPFTKGQIKIILNDRVYEKGTNHPIEYSKSVNIAPQF